MSDVEIQLSKKEALVLFEFLSRFSEKDILGIEDQSETKVLSNIECSLEKDLVEAFQDNYIELIKEARNELRDEDGTNSENEKARGNLAFWLAPQDIEFIANEWRKIPEGVAPEVSESWSRIAFRAMSALHKSGIEYEPKFPGENEKYKK